jgi:hypothetical protein
MNDFNNKELINLILHKYIKNDNNIKDKQKILKYKGGAENAEINVNDNVQSVLVPKSSFTKQEAIDYVKEHFQYKKLDVNQRKNFYSFRQFDPHILPDYKYSYSIVTLKNGVELVIEYKHKIYKSKKNFKGSALPINILYDVITNGYNKTKNIDLVNVNGYVLDTTLSTNESNVYINEEDKTIIINYVGTYKLMDWSNNLQYLLNNYKNTDRFKRARDTFMKVIQKYNNYKIILVGHSQSAIITRLLNMEFGNKIYEVINLNPANLSEKVADNEYNIRSDFDIVSLLTNTKNLIKIKHESLNPLVEHSPKILLRLNPEHLIGRID